MVRMYISALWIMKKHFIGSNGELIGNLYMGQQMRVRIDGEYSEPGKVGRGVRQRCPLSPLLFNIYIEELVAKQ